MDFATLCRTYGGIARTTKRLEKTVILAKLLRNVPEGNMPSVMLLLQGRVFPEWDKRTLGVSQKLAIKAISRAYGIDEKDVVQAFKKEGDLGAVAASLSSRKQQATLMSKDLTLEDVLQTVRKLTSIEGTKSVDRKLSHIAQLLGNASAEEAQFILRIVLEDLRIGIAEGTIRDAIVQAFSGRDGLQYDPEANSWSGPEEKLLEWKTAVQDAIYRSNDLARVAMTAQKDGLPGLEKIQLTLGVPTRVMLAQRSTGVADALDRVGSPCTAEFKYDGFRMIIHKFPDGNVQLFTRRLEDVTTQFPDVVRAVQEHVKPSCILDSEAVGFDAETKKHTPFQEISQRIRRKYDIEELAAKLPVEINVFDVLLVDGKAVFGMPFSERRKLLEKVVPKKDRVIRPSRQIVTSSEEEIQRFYEEALQKGYEGLMLKVLDGPYKPGSRVGTWVKVKPTLDTLDLVVVGAEWGEGKRSGWLTSFTLACVDEGEFKEIGKVGTGFKELETEEGVTFKEMTELLEGDVISEDGKEVTVRPKVVLEVKCEEIQQSPSYASGFALRFPRVVRVRADRRPDEISTVADVLDLFEAQKGKA